MTDTGTVAEPAGGALGEPGPPPSRFWWGRPVRESLWQLELAALLADPLWRGRGVPRGAGAGVLLLPGFLSGDPSLTFLHQWLRRIGYRSYRAGITWNVDCANRAVQRLEQRLDDVVRRTGSPVTVVGHSRGGLFARVLARRRRAHIGQVVTLGSPLGGELDTSIPTAAAVATARLAQHLLRPDARRQGCFTRACRCGYTADATAAVTVPLTSIYTRQDGIVWPASCRVADAVNIEVGGSHLGLGVNVAVYRHLARLLAEGPPGE